jgi:hypothetical protein
LSNSMSFTAEPGLYLKEIKISCQHFPLSILYLDPASISS